MAGSVRRRRRWAFGLAALQPRGLGGLAVVEAGGLRAWIAELDASRLGGSQSGLGADAVVIGAVDLPRMNLVMAGGAQGYQVSLVFAAALGTGDNVVVLQVVLRMSPSMAALDCAGCAANVRFRGAAWLPQRAIASLSSPTCPRLYQPPRK